MTIDGHDIRTATLTAYDEDGILGVQCDSYGSDAGGPPIELHVPFGSVCVPDDPDDEGACQIHVYEEGSRQHAVPAGDPRATRKCPRFPKGTTGAHGKYGGFAVFLGDDGTYQIYVGFDRVDDAFTKAHVLEFKAGGGITMRHSGGAGVSLTDDAAVLHAPDGGAFIELKNNGEATFNGNVKFNGAVTGPLGATPSAPVPFTMLKGF